MFSIDIGDWFWVARVGFMLVLDVDWEKGEASLGWPDKVTRHRAPFSELTRATKEGVDSFEAQAKARNLDTSVVELVRAWLRERDRMFGGA